MKIRARGFVLEMIVELLLPNQHLLLDIENADEIN